ncbi:hypothetical protein J6590_039306 [Homalodisca vitripennis]|nr:hypothetical protein J6590_039306 [Homalodisca vitripennis]
MVILALGGEIAPQELLGRSVGDSGEKVGSHEHPGNKSPGLPTLQTGIWGSFGEKLTDCSANRVVLSKSFLENPICLGLPWKNNNNGQNECTRARSLNHVKWRTQEEEGEREKEESVRESFSQSHYWEGRSSPSGTNENIPSTIKCHPCDKQQPFIVQKHSKTLKQCYMNHAKGVLCTLPTIVYFSCRLNLSGLIIANRELLHFEI